jgi:very-short-patch-repair endonuclease
MVSSDTVASRKTRRTQRAHAREMRHIPTDSEKKFWWLVRDRRFSGYKFKRQFLVGKFIVDFVCLEHNLIIELDGGQHADQAARDKGRDHFLKARGFRVQRFWNNDFFMNQDGVAEAILRALASPPHLGPLPQLGERK